MFLIYNYRSRKHEGMVSLHKISGERKFRGEWLLNNVK